VKTIGAVSRGQEKSIWERFRARSPFTGVTPTRPAEDGVPTTSRRRSVVRKGRRPKESTDWDAAALEMMGCGSGTVGPVKKPPEALWQRFRGAWIISSPATRSARHRARRTGCGARAICAEMEALAAPVTRPVSGAPGRNGVRDKPQPAVTVPNPQSAIRNPQ
jgi:hypothetical protein